MESGKSGKFAIPNSPLVRQDLVERLRLTTIGRLGLARSTLAELLSVGGVLDNAVEIIFTFIPIAFEPWSQLGGAEVGSRYGCNDGYIDSADC